MLVSHDGARLIDSLSRSTRERLIERSLYPRPVKITAARIGFVRAEVEAWVAARIAARDQGRDSAADPIIRATAGRRGPHPAARLGGKSSMSTAAGESG